ncbi:MAG: hypothetical protein K0B06_07225 [Brevefilum sp.]|nr:hypothetical protein [Brevefilum sp.]
MAIFLQIIRILSALLMPIGALFFSCQTLRRAKEAHPGVVSEVEPCLRCGGARAGAHGEFTYTKKITSPRERVRKEQPYMPQTSVLGAESHFVCDVCARRYLRGEALVHVLLAVSYPVYLFVIVPVFVDAMLFPHVLLEILLLLLSVAGGASALDLFRSVRAGETPLAEARDRVAIQGRKKQLGTSLSYFTRSDRRHLKQ